MKETNPGGGNLKRLENYYEGEVVDAYESRRERNPSWHAENRAFEQFLNQIALPRGARVMDAPIGTGRFLKSFSDRGLLVIGRDISADMVESAKSRAAATGIEGADISIGDATAIELGDASVDLVVSVRFLVHLEFATVEKALREFARVTSKFVITHIRVATPGAGNAMKRGLNSWFRKLRGRSGSRRVKIENKAATMHERASIDRLFAECNLRLLSEVTTAENGKGYTSRMFLLEKAS